MPKYRDDLPAVKVYTVCDESRYLIVRNVPALGCGDELLKLFASYGDVEECKPMDGEECEPFTDVYWIKFRLVNNARFAKRKSDDFNFLGNRLQVSYAPEFENLSDTKDKLEGRRNEVLARLKLGGRCRGNDEDFGVLKTDGISPQLLHSSSITTISSDPGYFPSASMNQTVQLVRRKLEKVEACGGREGEKKARVDNRRRI